jgi:hypothetical protein
VLNLATLFGFTRDELVVLRLTMLAWMLPTDDHSFFEIMLAAQPHMPPELQMSVGLLDFGQMWPLSFTARTSGGEFHSAEVWSAVAEAMRTTEGARIISAMSNEAQMYIATILPQTVPAQTASSPSVLVVLVATSGGVLLLLAVAILIWKRRTLKRSLNQKVLLDHITTTS